MARDPSKAWGDPKWHMRRTIMLGVFASCAALVFYAFHWPPETIEAMTGFITPICTLIGLVLGAYLGIPEIKEIKGAAPVSRVTQTTHVEEVKNEPGAPPKPAGWGMS